MTIADTMELMRQGYIADRVWTGSRHVWLIDGKPCTRAIHALDRMGYLWTHYPRDGGSAGLNEAGKEAAAREVA